MPMRRSGSGAPDELAHGITPPPAPARGATRITVALVAKALTDLRRTVERTRMSQTDVVNRAISLYEFVDSELSQGAEFIVRKDGQEHLVKLL
jgi:hypothetical protein